MLVGLCFLAVVVSADDVIRMSQLYPAKHAPSAPKLKLQFNEMWLKFKKQFNKIYHDVAEENNAFKNFMDHSMHIDAHNKLHADGKKTYKLGLNHFADMSHSEWKRKVGGCLLKKQYSGQTGGSTFLAPNHLTAPRNLDWRQHGYVTAVKDQGQCGSCWSFSTTGALEGQHFKKTGHLVSLSEQQLVDCSQSFGNYGCNGGLMDLAFKYIKAVGGLETEEAYPYIDRMGPKPQQCHFNKTKVAATDSGFVDIPHGDESQLLNAVASQGPISVAIDAGHRNFMLYKEGIYNEPSCSSTELDHGVLVVGYGSEGRFFWRHDYWIVKNSWNTTWGEQGYIRMTRNKENQCGIASQASYPLV